MQGFFVPYLTGGVTLGVLAIGSTAPGLLAVIIDRFSQIYPDYRERVLRHEAAHFLVRAGPPCQLISRCSSTASSISCSNTKAPRVGLALCEFIYGAAGTFSVDGQAGSL